MPTYDYQCDKCGRFEKFQKMTDDPMKKCPKCGLRVHRLIGSGGGIIFKGSGFYENDYKKKRSGKKEESKKSCPGQKSDGCKGCSLSKPH